MHRIKNMLAAATLVALAVTTAGCVDAERIIYDGPLLVEISPYVPTGSYNQSWLITAPVQATDIAVTARAQLIGPHQETPINVSYEIETNGVAGTHYTLTPAGMSGTMTIQPGSSAANLGLVLHRGAVAAGTSFEITIRLTGADVDLLEPYRAITYRVTRPAA
jgi:hypothetical protein